MVLYSTMEVEKKTKRTGTKKERTRERNTAIRSGAVVE
tara:strand:- start:616 stop:729 length:114 start_codon:yes stop_codon:yes gene_type:complete